MRLNDAHKYQLFQNGQGPAKPPAPRRYCQTRLNYGIIWQLDHIIPCDWFDLTDINQLKACTH